MWLLLVSPRQPDSTDRCIEDDYLMRLYVLAFITFSTCR